MERAFQKFELSLKRIPVKIPFIFSIIFYERENSLKKKVARCIQSCAMVSLIKALIVTGVWEKRDCNRNQINAV